MQEAEKVPHFHSNAVNFDPALIRYFRDKSNMISSSMLLLFSLWVTCPSSSDSLRFPTLPGPSGQYTVGTSIFYIVDHARKSPIDSARARELMVELWYPASTHHGIERALYIPDSALINAMKNDEYLDLSPGVLDSWRDLVSHSYLNAPLASSPRLIPLILFSHGFGMSRLNYTSMFEDLASHGFIVAAIDHPGSGLTVLPDARVISFAPDPHGPDGKADTMVKDALFVLNALLDSNQAAGRFARRIDAQRIGMFGHSLGGAAALDMGRVDKRFRACANMDGHPFGKIPTDGLHQPSLMLLQQPGEPIHIPDQMRFERDSLWSAIIHKQNSEAYVITIKGMSHFNFSDLPFIVPDSLMTRNGGTIAPQRGHEIMTRILRAFFGRYLQNAMTDSFQEIAREYPEVIIKQLDR